MGRKGSWFSSVKKALSPHSKAKKAEKAKKKWFGKERPSVADPPYLEPLHVSHPYPLPPIKEAKLKELENEQTNHAPSIPVAIAEASEAAVATAEAASEAVRFVGKSKEEIAAIRIQTAFRGYMAKRALRALGGLARLKSLVDGPTVKRQTAKTLKCMQTLSRVQSQVQSRRFRMLEENRALQRQLLQKRAKELESLRMGEEWDDSLQSKEQIEASLLHKYEAAMRRERALAYSYTYQQTWKKSTRPTTYCFMNLSNPHWGWSWLERWTAPSPLNPQSTVDKDLNGVNLSIKTAAGEITKSFTRHQLNSDAPPSPQKPPSGHHSPATQAARRLKRASPRVSSMSHDGDSMSRLSIQLERNRRHSIGGSLIRADESLASSLSIPSYMATTHSAKAKLKSQSPSPSKESSGLAKKRLSFPPSPARGRQHSGPPEVETGPVVGNDFNGGSIS